MWPLVGRYYFFNRILSPYYHLIRKGDNELTNEKKTIILDEKLTARLHDAILVLL